MRSVEPSRVALVLSLVVLGGSLAAFASAAGVASAFTTDAVHEFAIEDGALVVADGERSRTLVADVRSVERIEIRRLDGQLVVHTEPRAPPNVSVSRRVRAKRIVTADGPVAESVEAAGGAAYTVRPVPAGVTSDRAAVVGADAATTLDRPGPANESAFAVRETDAGNGLVLERKPPDRPDRLLVVVHLRNSEVRYSAVVDPERETIESFVRFDPTTA